MLRLYRTAWPNREKEDADFVRLVEECVERASKAEAKADSLERFALDASTKEAAMHILHDIRIEVVRAIEPVYRSPFQAVEKLKSDIAEILCEHGGFGRLSRVSAATDRLEEIATVLRRLKGCRQLAVAVDLVRDFDTSSGVLLPEIRKHLVKLDPELATSADLNPALEIEGGGPIDSTKLSNTALAVNKIREDVVSAISASLKDKKTLPSQTAAFLLFEFVDRVVRDNTAATEWRRAHSQLREEIWPTEFSGVVKAKAIENTITEAINELEFACEIVHFRFAIT